VRLASGRLKVVLERVLLVTGTVGVGKSTVGREVCRLLSDQGDPNAFVDLDHLSGYWPRHADDPFNTRLSAENLGSVAANFGAAGARSLVVAGIVETQAVLDLYEHAVGIKIVVVRLTAHADVIERRLSRRYHDDDRELGWHLARAPELDAILDRSPVSTKTVDASASPSVVARAVLDAVRWTSAHRTA
jgi:hypothetical protein